MNGILCVNKPQGWTSFDVVAKTRRLLGVKKIGHAGTLDPMATGVLPLFVGKATRAISLLPDHNKSYRAAFLLGQKTDTLDRTGTVLERTESHLTAENIDYALAAFRGEIEQIPPMYSAMKQNGKRLYELAREGKKVERKPRRVHISRLRLLSFDERTQSGRLEVDCSAGTYIRSLCDDLGVALGVGAVLTDLERVFACGFSLSDCVGIEELERQCGEGTLKMKPIEDAFLSFPRVQLSERQQKLFCNGVALNLQMLPPVVGRSAVYGSCFLGIARPENGQLVIDKLLV